MLNGLDLFSGIGGIALALEPYVRPIAYCENDEYAQSVLLSRMREKRLPMAPIWDDVRTLRKHHLFFPVDIIYGGFPCQNISVTGDGTGLEGESSRLFFEIVRLAGELRPSFIFMENSPAITLRGLDRVLLEFTAIGYSCRWTIVSAEEVGAPHLRERFFLLAHANGERIRNESNELSGSGGKTVFKHNGASAADAAGEGLERWALAYPAWEAFSIGSSLDFAAWPEWLPKPAICRSDAGFSNRVDKLRGLGNACPPQQYREAFERLMGLK